MRRSSATILLVIATMFWGLAFIAQKSAMETMGPLTFMAPRYLIGGLLILPLALREYRRRGNPIPPYQWLAIAGISLILFFGSWLQQTGLITASVTNSGFLTGLYVFFVPLILAVFFRTRPHPIVWICAPIALFALYLMSGASIEPFGRGDYLVIGSAGFWAMHVLLLGYMAAKTGLPIFISSISFLATGVLSVFGMLGLETASIAIMSAGWVEILYTAVFSTAIGYTLQAMGQQHVPPANAAIILSGESLFAALGGALILGERLNAAGYLGAALLFGAIVLVETIPALNNRRAKT